MRTFVLMVGVAILAGCTSSPKVDTLEVHTPPEQCWTGSVLDDNGQRSVDGCGDKEYPVVGSLVSGSFQKKDNSTTNLCLRIMAGSRAVASQCTDAAYGVVTVTT